MKIEQKISNLTYDVAINSYRIDKREFQESKSIPAKFTIAVNLLESMETILRINKYNTKDYYIKIFHSQVKEINRFLENEVNSLSGMDKYSKGGLEAGCEFIKKIIECLTEVEADKLINDIANTHKYLSEIIRELNRSCTGDFGEWIKQGGLGKPQCSNCTCSIRIKNKQLLNRS